MAKSKRYTKKKNYIKKKNYTKKKINKRTKKYGYAYKKKKTYKKRKQKGGIQCLTVNNTGAAVPPEAGPPPEAKGPPPPPPLPSFTAAGKPPVRTETLKNELKAAIGKKKGNNTTLKYKSPSGTGNYLSPVLSIPGIRSSLSGISPKKVTETELPNIIVFWYYDGKKKLRDEFKKLMEDELGKDKKTHHWIWWVYTNICEITDKTPSKPNCELRNEADYKLLWENADYREIRSLADNVVGPNGTFIDWFLLPDERRMTEFEKLHKGEMVS